ncbi:MAG: hypothetical protein U0Q16_02130 [Bryobacteraceae bacterium]
MHEFHPDWATHSVSPDTAYYVIAGRGYAAVVNYVTLMASARGRDRIGRLPVLFIGQEDPWANYREVKMGQWPFLLSLPGFHNRPGFRQANQFLSSAAFSRTTKLECHGIAAASLDAMVESVERRGRELIVVANGRPIRAAKLDVCIGIGQSRWLDLDRIEDPLLLQEYRDSACRQHPWRRIVTGEQFLESRTLMPQRGKVCVLGGGATGAWCAEVGLKTGNEVLWVSKGQIGGRAFPDSLRNDRLLAGRFQGERPLSPELHPSDERLTWAEGYGVAKVRTCENGALELDLRQVVGERPRIVSSKGEPLAERRVEIVDQLIVASGQCRRYDETGSPAWLLRDLIPKALDPAIHLIYGSGPGRPVGLKDADDLVRILGASALTHPAWEDYLASGEPAAKAHASYRDSLCVQARMEASVTIAATNIAEANGYFDIRPNVNINAAPLESLEPQARAIAFTRRDGREPLLEAPAGHRVEYEVEEARSGANLSIG